MDRITIVEGDCRALDPRAFADADVMITDPPYSAHVHGNAVSQSRKRGVRSRDLGFEHLGRSLRRVVASAASSVKRWSLVYSDVESSTWLRLAVQAQGGTYVRTLPWVRWSMPQLSGDRPTTGLEHVCLFHGTQTGAKRWNGPGSLVALTHLAMRGEGKHKAQKPLDQALDLVSWFSDPDELVLDLFGGAGTTARACQILGRRCVSIELDPIWATRARERLAAGLSSEERVRVERFVAGPYEDTQGQPGLSAERATRRAADRERARGAL